jgi:hypothetical protein
MCADRTFDLPIPEAETPCRPASRKSLARLEQPKEKKN